MRQGGEEELQRTEEAKRQPYCAQRYTTTQLNGRTAAHGPKPAKKYQLSLTLFASTGSGSGRASSLRLSPQYPQLDRPNKLDEDKPETERQ